MVNTDPRGQRAKAPVCCSNQHCKGRKPSPNCHQRSNKFPKFSKRLFKFKMPKCPNKKKSNLPFRHLLLAFFQGNWFRIQRQIRKPESARGYQRIHSIRHHRWHRSGRLSAVHIRLKLIIQVVCSVICPSDDESRCLKANLFTSLKQLLLIALTEVLWSTINLQVN